MPEPGAERALPERLVRAALSAHGPTDGLADLPLEPVTGGLSNHAWRVREGDRGYFVRLGGPDAERLGVDRWSERALLGVVAAAGLAPGVVVCDPSNGFLVMDLVDGEPWRREEATRPENLRRVALSLSHLHGLPASDGIRQVSFEERARSLASQLDATGGSDAALATLARTAFSVLAMQAVPAVLCHNDVHHLNVLDNGERLWLVDWEYGGCGDPRLDLASFLCQHDCTAGDAERLLDAYGGSNIAPDALAAACVAFDYVQWLWYRLWAGRHPGAGVEYSTRAADIRQRLLDGSGRSPT